MILLALLPAFLPGPPLPPASPAAPFTAPPAAPPAPAAARTAAENSEVPPLPWRWPLDPPGRVVRPFAPPADPWLPGHRGVDLAARDGQVVRAPAPGRVAFARDLAGRGVVVLAHGRLRTTYEPVLPAVAVGTTVAAGDVIGTVQPGRSHCRPGSCLHWGLRHADAYLDPLSLLALPKIRLLPRWGAP